jgi:thiamine monophosphate synthase
VEPPPRLLALSPGDGRPLGPWLNALAAAGWPAVLLREKADLDEAWRPAAARAAALGLQIIVHADNPGARADPGGWPLHLPAGGPHHPAAWGRSCHSAAALDRAFAEGARYALLSPIWAPGSKPGDARPPLGPAALISAAAGRPVLALGGVDAARLGQLAAAGAWGAAVLGALATPDPGPAAAALRAAWRAAGGPSPPRPRPSADEG